MASETTDHPEHASKPGNSIRRVNRQTKMGLLFTIENGREALTIMESLRILRVTKPCGSNPEFLRMLSAMNGKDLSALRHSIERTGWLTNSEIVAVDD